MKEGKQMTRMKRMNESKPSGMSARTGRHHALLGKYNINPRVAMFTLSLSVFVDMLGYTMVLPLLPEIAKSFGAQDIMLGIIIASNSFASLIFGPIWGKISDTKGRRPILLISQVGTMGAFIMLGLSQNLIMIFCARLLDGVFGGQMPIIRAYITDITTPETRSSEIAKIQGASAFCLIIGPVVGGVLGAIDWRIPSFIAAGLGIITIYLTTRKLVESMPPERIADLQEEIERKKRENIHRESIWNRSLTIRLVEVFLINIATMMFTSTLAIIIDKRYGKGSIDIGLIIAFAGILMIIYAGFLMKPITRKLGEKRAIIVPFLFMIPSFLLFPLLDRFWMLYLFIIPFGYARTTVSPLIMANITKAVEQDRQGEASGWATNMQSIAQTIAPLISTGFLQVEIVFIGSMALTSYAMIGFFAAIVGGILLAIVLIDLRWHPQLYEYDETDQGTEGTTPYSL